MTGDAGFCQTALANQIVKQGGDFCLQVKGNQPSLQKSVIACFEHALPKDLQTYVDDKGGHGRTERREYHVMSSELPFYLHDNWTISAALSKFSLMWCRNPRAKKPPVLGIIFQASR